MWIEIINGPNLARIGQREPSIYGTMSMDTCLEQLHQRYDHQLRLTYFQSNHEGALLDRLYELHDAGADAIILNARCLYPYLLGLGRCPPGYHSPHYRSPYIQYL